jgi:Fe-S-cluster containining protein
MNASSEGNVNPTVAAKKGPLPMKQHIYRPTTQDSERIKQLLDAGGKQEFIAAVELTLRLVLSSLHVEAHYDPLIVQIKQEPWYQNLENTWEILTPQARTRQWQMLMSHLMDVTYASRPYCVRCGECCQHGSPSLHLEDANLLEQGVLFFKHLYTLRKGERAKHTVEGKSSPVQQEVIKIKEKPENGHCVFYEEQTRECAIYEHRPLQCQLQACWEPEALKKLWRQEKLTRLHLFKNDQALLKLIQTHDERCHPSRLDMAFISIHQSGDESFLDQILELLRYDTTFRSVLTEQGAIRPDELDLFFGRPLQKIVCSYGVRVDRDAEGTFHLVSDD